MHTAQRKIEDNRRWWQTKDSWNLTYYQSSCASRTCEDDEKFGFSLQEAGQLYAKYAFEFLICDHEMEGREAALKAIHRSRLALQNKVFRRIFVVNREKSLYRGIEEASGMAQTLHTLVISQWMYDGTLQMDHQKEAAYWQKIYFDLEGHKNSPRAIADVMMAYLEAKEYDKGIEFLREKMRNRTILKDRRAFASAEQVLGAIAELAVGCRTDFDLVRDAVDHWYDHSRNWATKDKVVVQWSHRLIWARLRQELLGEDSSPKAVLHGLRGF